jgi:hypothetical protein
MKKWETENGKGRIFRAENGAPKFSVGNRGGLMHHNTRRQYSSVTPMIEDVQYLG